MSLAELVAADMNFRHPERVREGKSVFRAEDMPAWLFSLCNVLDRIRVYPPGAFSQYRPEPEEMEAVGIAELGIEL